MNRKATFITVLAATILPLFVAGCQEASATSDTTDEVRRHRLIATENIQLKEQLAKKDAKIGDLTNEIAQCEQEKQALQKRADEEIRQNVREILSHATERNAELEKENRELKAEVERLKQSQ